MKKDNDSLKKWSEIDENQLLVQLQSSLELGLTSQVAQTRYLEFGPNILRSHKAKSVFALIWQQFKSVIVLLLFVAGVASFLLNEWLEGVAIFAVLVINSFIGFIMEFQATRSMEALRKLGRTKTTVIRDGLQITIDSEKLVPGDIVLVEGGDVVTVDMRLLEASRLFADESSLTGESLPVEKHVKKIVGDYPIAERENMLFKGTSVTNGSGKGLVVATGMRTELGRIAELTIAAEDEITPLEKRLDKLGQRLIVFSLFLVTVIGVMGALAGKDFLLMFETAVALAVATIPEGLPIVATIALARGMWRMSKHNALVNKLSAVETLGATTVIFTDKTGTLTENQMSVSVVVTGEGSFSFVKKSNNEKTGIFRENLPVEAGLFPGLSQAIKIGVLCNNAALSQDSKLKDVGDPMEVALLRAGRLNGLERAALIKDYPEVFEEAFDPKIRMMATIHRLSGESFVAVKGAPESVIEHAQWQQGQAEKELSEQDKVFWLEENQRLAQQGYRVLGLGYKTTSENVEQPYEKLVFVGLVAFSDPPRLGVKESIRMCHQAGIKVLMITGDQAATAKSIGGQIGLKPDGIYSRVSPEQKFNLIQEQQSLGEVVAMTGDGVNDAPALKKADIGIAMGERGTQVAREASDLILKDDNFNTIVEAIYQGRVVFSNIRRFVLYLLSCNISEVLIVFGATIFNAPLPILPLQILFLNLVTDVFPALALGMGQGDKSYLKNPPRNPKEPILTRDHWWQIFGFGMIITFSVLFSFWGAYRWLKVDDSTAVSISFMTLALAQVFHVFNMRSFRSRLFLNDITKNPYVWGAVLICGLLLYASIYIEFFREVLSLSVLNIKEWIWVSFWSLVPLLLGQILIVFRSLNYKLR